MRKARISVIGLAMLGFLVLSTAAPAFAHEKRTVTGPGGVVWNMKVGSEYEPPYTDELNAVQMFMTQNVLVNGVNTTVAVTGLQNYLKVNVTTGGHTLTLPLKTVSTDPTQYLAPFIPTVAGTYNYTFFGTINGTSFIQAFSCANGKFQCIADATAVEFPAPTPTQYQLANQISSVNATAQSAAKLASSGSAAGATTTTIAQTTTVVTTVMSSMDMSGGTDSGVANVAYAGVGIGILGLIVAAFAMVRKGTRS